LRAREAADKEVAEQKAVRTSFYAPQIYQFQTVGVFGTMFGTERGEYPILLFRPRSPREIRMAAWREAFWPTTQVGRTAMAIETKRLKNKEELEKTTGWRLKTWPRRFGRRVGRHMKHLLAHHKFAEKQVPVPYDPFWELRGRPELWETRVPEVVQVLQEQAAKDKAEKEKVAKEKARLKKAQGKRPSAGRAARRSATEIAPAQTSQQGRFQNRRSQSRSQRQGRHRVSKRSRPPSRTSPRRAPPVEGLQQRDSRSDGPEGLSRLMDNTRQSRLDFHRLLIQVRLL